MEKRRSLDSDGLDGILQQSDKPQFKPAWVKSLWTIPVIIALAVSVFLLQNLSQTPLSTKTTLAQNFPSNASEQTSIPAPLNSKQPLTTSHENSKIQEIPTNVTVGNEGQTIANSKAQVIPTLPAKTPPISGDDKTKPSIDDIFKVYFKFESSKTPFLSKNGTKKLIHFAKRCHNQISLTGHTCNLGTDAANQLLGWARANALKKLLITHGIQAQRIVTASKGKRNPAESNDTLAGRASNRRVELYCLEP